MASDATIHPIDLATAAQTHAAIATLTELERAQTVYDEACIRVCDHYSGRLGNPNGRGYGGSTVEWPIDPQRVRSDKAYRQSVIAAIHGQLPSRTGILTEPYAPVWRIAALLALGQSEVTTRVQSHESE